jgi:hypothetical protein
MGLEAILRPYYFLPIYRRCRRSVSRLRLSLFPEEQIVMRAGNAAAFPSAVYLDTEHRRVSEIRREFCKSIYEHPVRLETSSAPCCSF